MPACSLASDTVIEAENMTWPAGSGEVYVPSTAPGRHDPPRPYPSSSNPDPYGGIFGGRPHDGSPPQNGSPGGVLYNFPWDKMQVLPPY